MVATRPGMTTMSTKTSCLAGGGRTELGIIPSSHPPSPGISVPLPSLRRRLGVEQV